MFVFIFDSLNVTSSVDVNFSEFKYTTPKTFVDSLATTLAIAPLVDPKIFSPIIAFVVTLALAPNCILSKVGAEESYDSYIDIIFTTSG